MTAAELVGVAAMALYVWLMLVAMPRAPSLTEGIRRYGPACILSAALVAVACQASHNRFGAAIWAGVTVWRAIEWWRNRPPRPPRRRRSLATASS